MVRLDLAHFEEIMICWGKYRRDIYTNLKRKPQESKSGFSPK